MEEEGRGTAESGKHQAGVGIVQHDGHLERFVTSGVTRRERDAIGAPPQGRGILGLIIAEGRSFRIGDIATDPRRAGFPSHHPEMHSFLGVPITVRGRAVGNFYLTEKAGDVV